MNQLSIDLPSVILLIVNGTKLRRELSSMLYDPTQWANIVIIHCYFTFWRVRKNEKTCYLSISQVSEVAQFFFVFFSKMTK